MPYEPPPLADLGVAWSNPFADLGSEFLTELQPTPLPDPYPIALNAALCASLGLTPERLSQPDATAALAGSAGISGARPLASVYSGHQFGVWAGQLGDGRAILLGETPGADGPMEWQLKGAGRTPYSRMGDGRAVLRSSIREFLCSEAMHGLGIPTTRALALVGSPYPVAREEMETAAVVTRVAPSFVRFGHFEHFAARTQTDALRRLFDWVLNRHYPECRADQTAQSAVAFLGQVVERTAALIAQWQAVGFCHGVMNTDNMSILGLTIDYGPFQFLDGFNPGHVCNHSDTSGRYAYARQPNVAYWNLFCLGQSLLPLIEDEDQTLAALERYKTAFPQQLEWRIAQKLGLPACDALRAGSLPTETAQAWRSSTEDRALVESVLSLLAHEQTDFTAFWRRLCGWVDGSQPDAARDLFIDRAQFEEWSRAYDERLGDTRREPIAQAMRRVNPKFVLRNHLGELAIGRAKLRDHDGIADLLKVLSDPFDEHPEFEHLTELPPEWASSIEISCSS